MLPLQHPITGHQLPSPFFGYGFRIEKRAAVGTEIVNADFASVGRAGSPEEGEDAEGCGTGVLCCEGVEAEEVGFVEGAAHLVVGDELCFLQGLN